MDALTAGLISAGGSILQGLFGQSSAQASMDFQKEVLQNRNQWMVQDLKKAGLNPILAAGATSSGSASGAQASIDNPGEKAVSSAMQYKMADIAKDRLITDQREAQSRINKNNAERDFVITQSNAVQSEIDYKKAKTAESVASTELIGATAEETKEKVKIAQARVVEIYGQVSKLEADIRRSEADRQHLIEQIKVARSQVHKNALEADLAKANTKVARQMEEGRILANEGLKLTNALEAYNLPLAQQKSEFYSNTFGKWVYRIGETIKAVSPFVPSSVSVPSSSKPPIGFK